MIRAILTGLALAAGLNASMAMACDSPRGCIVEDKKPCERWPCVVETVELACFANGAGCIIEEKKPCDQFGRGCVVEPVELACTAGGFGCFEKEAFCDSAANCVA